MQTHLVEILYWKISRICWKIPKHFPCSYRSLLFYWCICISEDNDKVHKVWMFTISRFIHHHNIQRHLVAKRALFQDQQKHFCPKLSFCHPNPPTPTRQPLQRWPWIFPGKTCIDNVFLWISKKLFVPAAASLTFCNDEDDDDDFQGGS